ncbi:hypothetical protein M0802_015024 [Mischocyttarus mexicanus]|nr:hypothetical protein M0802_015030 [Mischocyttarus mexicanus]KAI4475807.1 hypothetical protein M0802_015024 [Mischocyttarus mexicanus]
MCVGVGSCVGSGVGKRIGTELWPVVTAIGSRILVASVPIHCRRYPILYTISVYTLATGWWTTYGETI